jgi:hypothetical protein
MAEKYDTGLSLCYQKQKRQLVAAVSRILPRRKTTSGGRKSQGQFELGTLRCFELSNERKPIPTALPQRLQAAWPCGRRARSAQFGSGGWQKRRNMRIPVVVAFCFATSLVLGFSCVAQEVGAVDLRPSSSPPKTTADGKKKEDSAAAEEKDEKKELPGGCEKLLPGIIADGFVNADDNQPRLILVEVVKISETEPEEGSELDAEVRLQNTGARTIEIPWSSDPNATETGQGKKGYEWQGGYFEVLFRAGNPNGVMLKSLSPDLYGTRFHQGSLLTLQPGEWVTAKIKFKLEAKYLYSEGEFRGQQAELFVRWEQVSRVISIVDCKVRNGFYRYDYFYKQENRGVTIHVAGEAAKPSGEHAAKPEEPWVRDISGSLADEMDDIPPR